MKNKVENRLLYLFVFSIPIYESFFLGLFVSYFSALSSLFAMCLLLWSWKKFRHNRNEFLLIFVLALVLFYNIYYGLFQHGITVIQLKRLFHVLYLYSISYILYKIFTGSDGANSVELVKKAVLHGFIFCFIFSLFEYLVFQANVIDPEFYFPFDLVFHALRPSLLYDNNKMRSVSAEANYFGMFLVFSLPLILSNYLKSKVAVFALICMFIFMMYNTQSRFVLVALSLYFSYKFISKYKFLKYNFIILALILIVFGISENNFMAKIGSDDSLSVRLGITLSELNIFLGNPFFGVGIGNVGFYIMKFSNALTNSSPDFNVYLEGGKENIFASFNIFSQLLAELGIFAIFFVAAILYPFTFYSKISINDRWILESYALTIISMMNFSTIHFYAFPLMIGMSYALVRNK